VVNAYRAIHTHDVQLQRIAVVCAELNIPTALSEVVNAYLDGHRVVASVVEDDNDDDEDHAIVEDDNDDDEDHAIVEDDNDPDESTSNKKQKAEK
jgi:hypothetical protein